MRNVRHIIHPRKMAAVIMASRYVWIVNGKGFKPFLLAAASWLRARISNNKMCV